MTRKLKEKKCRNPKCRSPFMPVTEWQKFCSPKCAWTVKNKRNAKLQRLGQKVVEAQEGAA